MRGLLADADIRGQVRALAAYCAGQRWAEYWSAFGVPFLEFEDVGRPLNASDSQVWTICQERELLLITANRNRESDDSLEATIRTRGTINSLPVLTVADPNRILLDSEFANSIIERLLDVLLELDRVRGCGRLYLPR